MLSSSKTFSPLIRCFIFTNFLKFSTFHQILSHTNRLVQMDSIKLEKLCQNVLRRYDLKKNKAFKQEQHDSNQEKKTQKPEENSIIQLYKILTEAKVGFLKGDIHSQLIFKFNRMIKDKVDKERQTLLRRYSTQELYQKHKKSLEEKINNTRPSQEDYKNLLQMVTQHKYFRLPKKGIINVHKQDKNNLYQRQLVLQIVSNQQSYSKFQNILQSLKKLGKVHLSECLRKYMIQWFPPVCQAIRQQQQKCRNAVNNNSNIEGDRKIYAQHFLQLTPQKLASVCLSQLMKEITKKLFNSVQEQNGFELYSGIKYQSLCMNLSKWVCIQTVYEKEQTKFKQVMRIYDNLFKQEKKRRQQKAQLLKRNQSNADNQQNEQQSIINFEIERQAEQLLDKSQSQIKKKTNNSIQQQENHYFQQKVKQIQTNTGYRFIKPKDRNNFLLDIANKLTRSYSKFRHQMPEQVQFHIGSILIYLMKQIVKIKNKSGYKIPLLNLQHKLYSGKDHDVLSIKILRINQHFLNTIQPQIQKQNDLFLHLDRSLPTIIKPLQWVDYEIGGYYQKPTSVMRINECKIQQNLIKYGDISRVYNVLNYLGGIGWKINKKVLNVVESIWQEGGGYGEVPKRYSQMVQTYVSLLKKQKNPHKIKFYSKKIQLLRDQHSLRSDFNLKLNIARAYGKLDRFHYPHNLDFRGRVYPIPPHLNHIGNDLSRGLLTFADGRKLGKTGLKWLKIHCANLMGKDKATLPEKLQFTEANLDLIEAIANDPLKNREWLSYEDCWQALGSIFQLNDALKSSNPQQYVSNLHIHQDGSCNGLQHYAALGRDMQGAYQVNLGPTERPGDVYTHVAKMVIKMVDEDIANPESINHEIAKKCNQNIKRKTIKQTVMTSVYGVTFIGAREQIHRQIKDQKFIQSEQEQYKASIYLAKLTLQAISNLFERAHLIKKWLINCAKIVSQYGNPVGWITPMGLPVVQPYRTVSQSDQISTIVQKLRLPSHSDNLPVNKSKQKSAFPPNYVHSLDSTHMMYTSQRCKKLGLTFAAVHDSYWTHAGTVETMNQLLREQFIRLHSEPLLQNLKSSLQKRYVGVEFPPIPDRGEFNLQKIKQSLYFFS